MIYFIKCSYTYLRGLISDFIYYYKRNIQYINILIIIINLLLLFILYNYYILFILKYYYIL